MRQTGIRYSEAFKRQVANRGVFIRSGEKVVLLQLPLSLGGKITSESIMVDWGLKWIDTLEDYARGSPHPGLFTLLPAVYHPDSGIFL